MASIRLTKVHKQQIAHKALRHAFGEREKAHSEAEHAFADELYASYYNPDLLAKMGQLPEDFFPQPISFCVKFPQYDVCELTMSAPRIVGKHHWSAFSRSPVWFVFENGDPEFERYHQLRRAREDLKKAKVEARNALEGMLDGINTLSRLRAEWPEGKEFYDWVKPPVKALAVTATEVSLKLGLL